MLVGFGYLVGPGEAAGCVWVSGCAVLCTEQLESVWAGGVSGHVMLGLLGGTTRAGVGVGWGSQNYLGRLVGLGAGPEGPVVHHSRGALVGLG